MKSTLYREAAGYLSGKINEVTNLQGSCWIIFGEDKLMKSEAAGYFAEKTTGVKCLLEMCREWIFFSGKSNDKSIVVVGFCFLFFNHFICIVCVYVCVRVRDTVLCCVVFICFPNCIIIKQDVNVFAPVKDMDAVHGQLTIHHREGSHGVTRIRLNIHFVLRSNNAQIGPR